MFRIKNLSRLSSLNLMSLSLDFDFIHVRIQSHYGLKKELKLVQIIAARMTAYNHLI